MEIGVQLYTVRAYTRTPEDFALTLRRIADIGYRTVQVSATCPFAADWLREELRKDSRPAMERVRQLDELFIRRNLSPGGCADLLAVCYFLHDWRQSLPTA